jgi:hypothetical protein
MQVNRSEWRMAATYLVSGFTPQDVAAFMGCTPRDIEGLLTEPEFQSLLAERRAAVKPSPAERILALTRRAAEAVARAKAQELQHKEAPQPERQAAEPEHWADKGSLIKDAVTYLHEAMPNASVRMVHMALASTSRFIPGEEEPRVIDLRAALDWLWSHAR